MEGFLKDERASKLAEIGRQVLERTIEHVWIREIVAEEFQQPPRILEGSSSHQSRRRRSEEDGWALERFDMEGWNCL